MSHRLRAEVGVVVEQLHRLLTEVRPRIESLGNDEPDPWDAAAFASMLAAFYNGVENALVRIESLLETPPGHEHGWHAALLERAGCRPHRPREYPGIGPSLC